MKDKKKIADYMSRSVYLIVDNHKDCTVDKILCKSVYYEKIFSLIKKLHNHIKRNKMDGK